MSQAIKNSDFVSKYRGSIKAFLDAHDDLLSLRREWDARALSVDANLPQEDLDAAHPGIQKADLTSAVSSVEAFTNLGNTGHFTNFYKVS